ncbi:HNH endonuclease [Caldibacillus debilis]|uniref:HNH endonuclease n=1 Tax=Caldibacillus debilis TaxID=301148 RepID=UPI000E3A7992|nr:HNH endonuclease signature motif containing protein [Caldibacillus debilis]REJ29312.1 MAG: HNH endonuclease [Caldibacillus debilis]
MQRLDKKGAHRANYERNKKRIFATQNTCGICGHPVDFSLKPPHPMSATIDHIIPVAKGGHPSDIDNLQLAHWTCNRQKSDKIFRQKQETKQAIGNRVLPQTIDWMNYRENQTESKETKKTVIKIRRKLTK